MFEELPWLDGHVLNGDMWVRHSIKGRECKIEEWHLYEQCALNPSWPLRMIESFPYGGAGGSQ